MTGAQFIIAGYIVVLIGYPLLRLFFDPAKEAAQSAMTHWPHVTNKPRLGFVAEHGSRDRPVGKGRR